MNVKRVNERVVVGVGVVCVNSLVIVVGCCVVLLVVDGWKVILV